jgi:hypothetical protein
MHNDFIYGIADMPFDDEPLPPTANADYDTGSVGRTALSWPDACAAVAPGLPRREPGRAAGAEAGR